MDKYRGFRRSLRCLVIDTAVVRPASGGSHPVHLKADLLMTPEPRRPVELFGPLSAVALTAETAFQPSVGNQRA